MQCDQLLGIFAHTMGDLIFRMPYFGESSAARDASDYGFWSQSEDLDAIRSHLGFENWTFWPTSIGGFAVLIYSLDFQDMLTAFIGDSTAPSHNYKDDPNSHYPNAHARHFDIFQQSGYC